MIENRPLYDEIGWWTTEGILALKLRKMPSDEKRICNLFIPVDVEHHMINGEWITSLMFDRGRPTMVRDENKKLVQTDTRDLDPSKKAEIPVWVGGIVDLEEKKVTFVGYFVEGLPEK